MSAGRELLKVWGIPIRIHSTWFFVFALVSWSLASGYFPHEYPGWSRPAYWLAGVVSTLLLFGSVVVHELGHARVARHYGLPIRSITLFAFGGVAQIGGEPASPGVEFRIAIAGPITSLALALGFAVVWLVVRPLDVIAAPALWLVRINTVVALFNMVPGFPLDGGRVLRAIVWRWTGRFRDASRIASQTGQLVALGFIGLGVVVALNGNVVNGLWMAFVGWFLQSAAATGAAESDLREHLREVTVSRTMTKDFRCVPRGITLERLVQDEILGAGRRCFLIADAGRLRGLLTLRDVKGIPRERWPAMTAEQAMTPAEKLTTVNPGASVLVALEKMDAAELAQLPVVEGETLVGLIGREQIVRYVSARAELGV